MLRADEPTVEKAVKHNKVFSLRTLRSLAKGRIPGQVVIQYTDRCNASCAQCGMRASSTFTRSKLEMDATKRLIDAMAEKGVQSISFTGGEPLLYLDEVAELATYAGKAGIPYIRTGTNGFIFRGADKEDYTEKIERIAAKLADTPINTFWVSVDSAAPEVHEKNRGFSGIIEGMRQALPVFHLHGLYPSANLGINRYTGGTGERALPLLNGAEGSVQNATRFESQAKKAFSRFYDFVAELGFTIVNACYPMSMDADESGSDAVYAATSEDDFIRFSKQEKILLFKALHDTLPAHRSRLRIFTPQSSLLALIRQYEGADYDGYPCRGGVDFFFIDSKEMNTYPCGYRGTENLGKFWDLDLKTLVSAQNCKKCDWECFRDPSELIGPLTQVFNNPLHLAKRLFHDKEMLRTWVRDLRYYRACEYFNARKAPDMVKLAKFA